VAVDSSGTVYVADFSGNVIWKLTTPSATVLAGSGSAGFVNATGTGASFNGPLGLAVDGLGNVYVADSGNHAVRKITPGGVVTTFAGSGSIGSTNGVGTAASFNRPFRVAIDGASNVYVADDLDNRVRKITPAREVTTYAGTGAPGSLNGSSAVATFQLPTGVATFNGIVYVADWGNHLIRQIVESIP
jgi:outer membrane protein assembly factor BamB